MDLVEKKFDKILRRLSSKSRRAARRIRKVEEYSSGSELDDSSSKIAKTDHKNSSNRKAHIKSSNRPTPTNESHNQLLSQLGFTQSRIKYFDICLATCMYKHMDDMTRKTKENEMKLGSRMVSKQSHSENALVVARNKGEAQQRELSEARMLAISRRPHESFSDTAVSALEKSCESEDVDYISEYSFGGRAAQKLITELDMSMDESLPESCERESGYLSSIDLRYSTSSADSPALSPLSAAVTIATQRILVQHTLATTAQQSFNDDEHKGKSKIALPKSLDPAGRDLLQDNEADIPDYMTSALILRNSISETKYITTIFELSSGGIVALIDDVLSEFNTWFQEEIGLMGIACEVQWSVPEKHRHHFSEKRMKDALHYSLRQNNRRILNMKNKNEQHLPLTFASAVTEENCARDCRLKCFQGVYRRYYTSLLPYRHVEASTWHKPYWNIEETKRHDPLRPNPERFIFGHQPTNLQNGSLIAVNVLALKLMF